MYLLASSDVIAWGSFDSRYRNELVKPVVMSLRLVFVVTFMSLCIVLITLSIASPRARSERYRSYFSTSGWSELRLETTWAMLVNCRVIESSVIVGTIPVGKFD